jgi:hypothetical protein
MTTVASLRNPKRKSGFDRVQQHADAGRSKRYRGQCYGGSLDSANHSWLGPWRATAAEAAQDYCDHVNGNGVATPVILRTAGHKVRRRPGRRVPDEVAAAYGVIRDYRARTQGIAKNYIYLIAEWGGAFVKIGESAKPEARPAELQTGNRRTLVLLAQYEVTTLKGADKAVHQQFVGDHEQNEWFRPTDAVLSHFGVTLDELLRRCGGKTKEVKAA